MRRCQWASCPRLAVHEAEGWHFCDKHLRSHRVLDSQPGGIRRRPVPNSQLSRAELLACIEDELHRPIPPPIYRPIEPDRSTRRGAA